MAYKTVAPGRQLEKAAAASYNRARRDGLPAGITSARRANAEQHNLFMSRYRAQETGSGTYGDVRWYQGVRYVRVSSAGSVAIPGSEWSRHERGLSLDLPEPARAWMRAHGHRYGWIKDLVPGEPWHFEYDRSLDTKKRLAIIPTFNAAVRREWQRQIGVTADGIFGAGSISALQRLLNRKAGHGGFSLTRPLLVDGIDGARTWKAVQKLLNVWGDRGVIGLKRPLKITGWRDPRTVLALRKSLNANLWE